MAAVWLCRRWGIPHVGNTCNLLPKFALSWNIPGCLNVDEITMRYRALFVALGGRGWRTCPCFLVPKQRLPKLLFLWPSAHRGLAELLSLMFSRSGLWGTSTCLAAEVSFSQGGLCCQLSSACGGLWGPLQLVSLLGGRAALPPTWVAGEFSLVLQTEMTWNTGSPVLS